MAGAFKLPEFLDEACEKRCVLEFQSLRGMKESYLRSRRWL